MKKTIPQSAWALLLLIFLMAGCDSEAQNTNGGDSPSSESAAVKLQNVDIDRFEALLQEEGVQVLDVRTPAEVAAGMVPGAKHINVNDADFGSRAASELDKDKPVAVYCKMGGRSSRASDQLAKLGFKTIYNYTGGMSEWAAKGKPIAR